MKETSIWEATAQKPDFAGQESPSHHYEVIVLGAGLTGVTTALLLARAGVKVAVIEADTVGSGTSGRTTGKITVQHGIKLYNLNTEKARAYLDANSQGLRLMERLKDELKISCDYEKLPVGVFALTDADENELEKELRAYDELGLRGDIESQPNLPFPTRAALVIADQAQLHPLKYLYALAEELKRLGVPVIENNRALSLQRTPETITVQTQRGSHVADKVVLATGYPLVEYPGLFFLRLYHKRTYLLAARTQGPNGMYINAGTPSQTLRPHSLDGERWTLIGGYGHRTAKEDKPDTGLESCKGFLEQAYPGVEAEYGWSAQDTMTIDNIPYVGALYSEEPNIYAATGYAKWGLTNSAAAAMMIVDEITGEDRISPEIREVFSPRRVAPGASAKGFFMQAGEVVREFTAGYITIPSGSYDDLAPGTGAVMRVDGDAQAVYKDEDGRVTAFNAHCTHLGCPLEYNESEHSFDCACHGSRFAMTGEVLEGPATKNLKRVDEESEE